MSSQHCIRGLLLLVVAACHGSPPATVPLAGDRTALTRLAGRWTGSYENPAASRGGSILFTLTAGDEHAQGDVVMVPRGMERPLRPAAAMQGAPSGAQGPAAEVLTIDFVRMSGDSVSGTVAPFFDPECRCTATATFRGKLEGDVIRGRFTTTQGQGGATAEGSWEVRRRG